MTQKKKRILIIICAVLAVISALGVWVAIENSRIVIGDYTVMSDNLPESFYSYRIAHVSDLHNAEFGDENAKLLKVLQRCSPDIIAITGDIIDSNKTDIDVAIRFTKEAMKIAPCYYVTGNHESNLTDETYLEFENALIKEGVVVLRNRATSIEIGGEKINLIGIDDPAFTGETPSAEFINEFCEEDSFNVLLAHRPEYFNEYTMSDADLVLSGHAHGGQFRLPFVGGLVAPGQGLFPEYDSGIFESNGTTMVVSRGLGNSIIPVRFNNPPEVVLIFLKCNV